MASTPTDLPLVEAIVELRWQLGAERGPGRPIDPNYRILVGRFSERVAYRFPDYEPLPNASIPDEMIPYLVQHRFKGPDRGWPLTQLGPGVLTINDTENYQWPGFKSLCLEAVNALVESYPVPDEFRIGQLTLRYINALLFDFDKSNVVDFIADRVGIGLSPPSTLFADTGVDPKPQALNLTVSYPVDQLGGAATLKLATGYKEGAAALVSETLISSESSPSNNLEVSGVDDWLEAAHAIAHDWHGKLFSKKPGKKQTTRKK